MRLPSRSHLAWLLMAAGVCVGAVEVSPYQQSVEKWRQSYEAKLKADDGWLTVSALLWLHEGENTFGSASSNAIVLRNSYVPAKAGYFDLHAGKTVIHVNPGVPITLGGEPVKSMELRPDSKVDRLAIGDLTFFVHASGSRYGIRVKDKNNQLRKDFKGLHWFPVN
ncbi:MAG TPA: hypothetical protein VLA83_18250, partial [Candidatus Binatia bacterium]|nr:hypothetical protein [Candidatus Binatia bacterium]